MTRATYNFTCTSSIIIHQNLHQEYGDWLSITKPKYELDLEEFLLLKFIILESEEKNCRLNANNHKSEKTPGESKYFQIQHFTKPFSHFLILYIYFLVLFPM